MKKQVTAREFQHGFARTTASLKPGQSITITKRGKPLGIFTRLPSRPIKLPDFLGNLKKLSYSQEAGDQILKEFNDSVS